MKKPPQIDVDHATMTPRSPRKSQGDAVLIEAVERHLRSHVGAPSLTYHDRDCTWVHLDVHIVPPGPRGDYWLLCTSGMSERPLRPALPVEGRPSRLWSELVMLLPGTWELTVDSLERPEVFWPIGWLRFLARKPHATGVGYLPGDTVAPLSPPGGERPSPFDGALFLSSTRIPQLRMVGRELEFLAVCPLLPVEIPMVRDHGSALFLEKLRAGGVEPEKVDLTRASVVDTAHG